MSHQPGAVHLSFYHSAWLNPTHSPHIILNVSSSQRPDISLKENPDMYFRFLLVCSIIHTLRTSFRPDGLSLNLKPQINNKLPLCAAGSSSAKWGQ